MHQFHLFRLRLNRTASLFDRRSFPSTPDSGRAETTPDTVDPTWRRDLILAAIEAKPSEELRRGQTWCIGNVERLDPDFAFFALGKVTKATHGLYDADTRNFVVQSQEEARHTYVLVDVSRQVCAIAHKAQIAPDVTRVGANLAKLLTHTDAALMDNTEFTMSTIVDPADFLTAVRSAERVLRFEMTVSPPNPFDVDRQFHRPMEELLGAVNATKGRTSFSSDGLDREAIDAMARSAASAGETASARIVPNSGDKPILRRLGGDHASVRADEIVTSDDKRRLAELVRLIYTRIRGQGDP